MTIRIEDTTAQYVIVTHTIAIIITIEIGWRIRMEGEILIDPGVDYIIEMVVPKEIIITMQIAETP
jgi:hypothetical protein